MLSKVNKRWWIQIFNSIENMKPSFILDWRAAACKLVTCWNRPERYWKCIEWGLEKLTFLACHEKAVSYDYSLEYTPYNSLYENDIKSVILDIKSVILDVFFNKMLLVLYFLPFLLHKLHINYLRRQEITFQRHYERKID